jgi:transcriptional regulator with GAF, ATPase, and Fis domain
VQSGSGNVHAYPSDRILYTEGRNFSGMQAKFVFIAGPLRGGIFPLAQAEGEAFSIGRSVDTTLCIEDPSVSRHHCILTRRGQQFTIADCGSANGTYVNGLPLREHQLRNGDEIEIGQSMFLFVIEGEVGAEKGESGSRSEKGIHLSETLQMPVQATRRFEGILSSLSGVRCVEALSSFLEAIPSAKGLEDLQRRIIESLSRAVPVEHGMIVLAGDSPGEFTSILEWKRDQDSRAAAILPAAVMDRMIREPTPILWNRTAKEANPPEIQIGPHVRSLVAVPLVAFERLIGVLCLTTSDSTVRFDDDHLCFLTKIAGIVAVVLDGAVNAQNQETEALQRRAEMNLEHNMLGESPQMQKVYEVIAKVARTDSTVMICGESGTGKELAARAIHRNSLRARKPFIAINCAALPETLLESELFGHEKGAFTGAVAQKKGKFEAAHGGAIFFDEVSEMSPLLQAKLLRVLQEREFERVGGNRTIKADVQVIAATNQDMEEAVRRGTFRPDLYYRLKVVSLTIPPLRARPEDIEPLANYFAQKYSWKLKRWIAGISKQAHACLKAYAWPGNVRELENVIERALVLGTTDLIELEDLPDSIIESNYSPEGSISGFHAKVTEAKQRLILETLEKVKGDHLKAAKLLEIHPNSLHRLIRNLNLKVMNSAVVVRTVPSTSTPSRTRRLRPTSSAKPR